MHLIKNYAEEETSMSQPRKMLMSSYTLQNGTIIIPLLLIYLHFGLFCTNKYVLLSTFQENVSTDLCSQHWTQQGNVTKIQTQVSSQKIWSFKPTAATVTRSWTGAETQWQSTSATKRHNPLSIVNSRKLDHVNHAVYEAELSKVHIEKLNRSLSRSLSFNFNTQN